MGTSNFYNKNASSIFVLEIEDSLRYEDKFHYIGNRLSELDYFAYDLENAITPDSNNRSFMGKVIGEKTKHLINEDQNSEILVTIRAIIRSGYYEHANLDWEINTERVFPQRLTPADRGWIRTAKDELIEELEGVYEHVSTMYGVTATFSNGNSIYHKKES